MRLLLTSGGIRNEELRAALFDLAGAPAGELKLAFIPTAANIRDEDKGWLIDDLLSFRNLGFHRIDIVDIAALTREQFEPRLAQAQVIVFGGGDTRYLLENLRDKGFSEGLRELLATRILVGISAGSVMCCPIINPGREEGLHYVDFLFVPHMGSAFARRTIDDVRRFAAMTGITAYWAGDSSGILVNGSEVRPVGSEVVVVEAAAD